MEEPNDIEVRDFEFDEFNRRHLAAHGLTADAVWDVWLDEPWWSPTGRATRGRI